MVKIAIVGIQYGDEGKGAIVDEVTQRSLKLLNGGEMVLVRRYQGGGNAGHTIVVDDEEFKLHLPPSGIVNERTYNLIGREVFTDPSGLMKEVKGLRARGVHVSYENFGVASTSHVTLRYHVAHDQADFNTKIHASTGKGIKETAADLYGRLGIRFCEFLDRRSFINALEWRFKDVMEEPDFKRLAEKYAEEREEDPFSGENPEMNIDTFVRGLKWGYHTWKSAIGEKPDLTALADSYAEEREYLQEFEVLEQTVDRDPKFVFGIAEGAQGAMLNPISGPYPGTTSSDPCRVPKGYEGNVIGVMKFYDSSAGTRDRAFVGAMDEDLQQKVREPWGQFGTTTGKPRDVGWVNIVELRYAARESGARGIIATCGDQLELLAKLGEPVKAVEAVKVNGKLYTEWDTAFDKRGVMRTAEPVFRKFEPWDRFLDDNGDLTDNAQRFADWIQEQTDVPILAYRYGPKRGEMKAVGNLLSTREQQAIDQRPTLPPKQ